MFEYFILHHEPITLIKEQYLLTDICIYIYIHYLNDVVHNFIQDTLMYIRQP